MYYQDFLPCKLEIDFLRCVVGLDLSHLEGTCLRQFSYADAFSLLIAKGVYPEVFWSHRLKQWMWSTGDSPQCAATWHEAADNAIREACAIFQQK